MSGIHIIIVAKGCLIPALSDTGIPTLQEVAYTWERINAASTSITLLITTDAFQTIILVELASTGMATPAETPLEFASALTVISIRFLVFVAAEITIIRALRDRDSLIA